MSIILSDCCLLFLKHLKLFLKTSLFFFNLALSTSMPSSLMQNVIKKTTQNNSSFVSWAPRKFPLLDKDFEKMLKEDLNSDQYTHESNTNSRSYNLIATTTKSNNHHRRHQHISTLHTSNSSNDQIDALMQIES